MKFKDKISFLTYLTSPENYGDLTVEKTYSLGSYNEMVLTFKNSEKALPARLFDKVYSIIDEEFLHSPKIEFYDSIDNQTYVFSHVDGVVNVTDGSYSTGHSYEEDEIEAQLKDLLDEIIFQDYIISISISGKYLNYGVTDLVIEKFYLGVIDEDEEESVFDDIGDIYKNRILKSLVEWVIDFSNSSSHGEYDYESFSLEIDECGKYDNYDNYYSFGEISNYCLHGISVLEDEEDEVSEEIEIDIS